ncbi:aminotransferase class IV family protein [Streptomyces termitum]|nr:aminotransferase class IV family protein [Streptomyces termitum]
MATLNGIPLAAPDDVLPLALTSYGHFTSMRVDDGRVRGLRLHLERLARDCRAVFGTDLDIGCVRAWAREALPGRKGVHTVRITVYDPLLDLGRPAASGRPSVLVTVRPAGTLSPPPLRAMSVPHERDQPEVKHCGLFGALRARRAAQLEGFDDALLVDRDGHLSEGVTWNVGFVDSDGAVVWPRARVLPGVTMALLRERAEHRVLPVTPARAGAMRAAFATNVSIGVRALSAVDSTPMDVAHPVLDRLRAAYAAIPGEEL